MTKHSIILLAAGMLSVPAALAINPPLMGWASWNHYHVAINEDVILSNAEAMATNGMKDAGYLYVNTDDGFFGGRDEEGRVLPHPERFPRGVRVVVDSIHSLGLKAGIYSDAGVNTCGSAWDGDTISRGCGLYGHDRQDLTRYLSEWDYDFIKVDWCGGQWLGLDEQQRYTEISRLISEIKPSTVYNVCRWGFPGEWVTEVADSWRISGDIAANFGSICSIIDLNADLWPYCSPGHYNDMDMLQVGRGMTEDEDRAHFTMWCMMTSPLLAGNDLTQMSPETLAILTNKEVIALNQDPLFRQARRLKQDGDLEVWAKPLVEEGSGEVAVCLFNRSSEAAPISFSLDLVGLDPMAGYTVRDLWAHSDLGATTQATQTFTVPSHGVVTLRLKGTELSR
ncbi:MAG: glycoside hydrolase family 27 protein [Bacteroidales bacterium]|nr:glycoside hydrolase family 27 protein [Bacteroidales bacterium]